MPWMPAQAGIQGDQALVFGHASWIPGLASFARNDRPTVYPSSLRILLETSERWEIVFQHFSFAVDAIPHSPNSSAPPRRFRY
jgi:hypothetical protein